MAYASLNAERVAAAAKSALTTLAAHTGEKNETHQRKTIMIERIGALANAAAQSPSKEITMTSEEFWLLSNNW
ncbi:hypothetical protein E3E12_04640 [Formicincola oecophyllae]|uniref:Uncharacterized protein n=1 Tax=Formicincola oecophyllae TaxID=2558361 RepID=A0A4Y6UAJ0_9PROT|nr:hypothetical protein [Formicincola oecophyllae]QDH13598.1 hypothetical protein E3E12_04640 [Formicincola oecophyllae]